MNEQEFFALISNETRRKILRSIAQEPKYLFQLSKELNKSQQSIQRHLNSLFSNGWIVLDQIVEGSKGPTRKLYRIAKNFSVRITLSQHSFDFDVFEITIGEVNTQKRIQSHITSLSEDLTKLLSQALIEKEVDFGKQIRKLDDLLDQLESIETFLLSRKLSITGELNEEISLKLEGDVHRKDRELAYTIYSSSEPITIDLLQKEIKSKRIEILDSLRRLHDKNLLPEHGLVLMANLESTLESDPR